MRHDFIHNKGQASSVTFECTACMQVRAHYRTVPYHNFFHCVDVTHATFRHAAPLCLACFSECTVSWAVSRSVKLTLYAEASAEVGYTCLPGFTATS